MEKSSTWEYLHELGFDDSDELEGTPQVKKNFGTFVLRGNLTTNRYYREVVIFYSYYVTAREMGEIEFELPRDLDSRERAAAIIYYYLRNHDVTQPPLWFDEANANQHLLPWISASKPKADKRIVIPIRAECRQSSHGDGAWWNIVDVIDDRNGTSLGDGGINEFDADNGFPDAVMESVLSLLGAGRHFEDRNAVFIVDLVFADSGTELASSTNRFRYEDTLNWPFRSQRGE